MRNRLPFLMVSVALILAFVVVVLGAYTRLTDSGLGCPDWPGCYGKMVLPHSMPGLAEVQQAFPDQPVEAGKAWKEMIHRYAAGTLGLLILALWIVAIIKRCKKEYFPLGLVTRLIILVAFQAVLGMWTVTWKLLPMVVMGHLLGGLAIFAILRYLQLRLGLNPKILSNQHLPYWQHPSRIIRKPWLIIGLLLVVVQIALGGWVSANYASLACVGFPQCNGLYLPTMNFHDAFQVSSVGVNYQGGNLDSAARITIQMIHRWNAILTAGYIFVLGVVTCRKEKTQFKYMRCWAIAAIGLVLVQFTLGIILVTDLLPLSVAVLHNAIAALLLLTMVSWLFYYNNETE